MCTNSAHRQAQKNDAPTTWLRYWFVNLPSNRLYLMIRALIVTKPLQQANPQMHFRAKWSMVFMTSAPSSSKKLTRFFDISGFLRTFLPIEEVRFLTITVRATKSASFVANCSVAAPLNRFANYMWLGTSNCLDCLADRQQVSGTIFIMCARRASSTCR